MPWFRVRLPITVEFDVLRTDEADVRDAIDGSTFDGNIVVKGGLNGNGFGCGFWNSRTTVDPGGIIISELDMTTEKPNR